MNEAKQSQTEWLRNLARLPSMGCTYIGNGRYGPSDIASERLVKLADAHDALVEACQALITASPQVCDCAPGSGCAVGDAIGMMRAALKLAGQSGEPK